MTPHDITGLERVKEKKQTHTSTTLPVRMSSKLFNRVTDFHQTWYLCHYVTI
jgi:hypothetical protein